MTEVSRVKGAAPSAEFFYKIYSGEEVVPWDIGKPQSAIVRAFEAGWFQSPVLDVGCGTGDAAIYLASKGINVYGFDMVPAAIEEAENRLETVSARQKIPGTVTFHTGDVFSHRLPNDAFKTLLDGAFFHCIGDDDAQRRYIDSISNTIARGGTLVLWCFSDDNPDPWIGPRRISEGHLRKMWEHGGGWRVEVLEKIKVDDNVHDPKANGWLMKALKL